VRQYLRMLAAMIMMASSVGAHAEQMDYNPAKVSDSLKAIFQFGSVSTKKALNANTVTLLTGTIGGTYVQFGADLASVLDDDGNLRVLPIIGRGSVQSVADILFLKGVDLGIVRADTLVSAGHRHYRRDDVSNTLPRQRVNMSHALSPLCKHPGYETADMACTMQNSRLFYDVVFIWRITSSACSHHDKRAAIPVTWRQRRSVVSIGPNTDPAQ
jgi:hypothetical protein